MLIPVCLISCLLVLVLGRELPKLSKSNDLKVVESQEYNFLEAPSYKRYQQSSGYNEEGGSAPEPYMFNFDIQDNENNKQFRKEESNGNAVKGSYGYTDANGLYRTVEYTADSEHGFRTWIKTNEPGMEYYTDNSKYPADVTFEVAETPRNLKYPSSDQTANNHYTGEKTNYRAHSKGKTYQQYNEPDQYAASNNYDSQHYGRSLNSEQTGNKEQANGNYMNYPGKGFEYQSAFSDGHSVYVDPSKPINSVSVVRSSSKSVLGDESSNEHYVDRSESNNKISTIKNLKFSNKTMSEKKDALQSSKSIKKPLSNLQSDKSLQQYKFIQQFRPFNEIREKFIRTSPRRFTGFVNNFARV